jgi:hypothetical protein
MTHHQDFNNPIFLKNSKFIPLPAISIPKETVVSAFNNFSNSLLWKIFFLDQTARQDYNPKFKLLPKPNVKIFPSILFTTIPSAVFDEIATLKTDLKIVLKTKHKLIRRPEQAITNLLIKHPDTTLALADKNLGFVAILKSNLHEMSLEHLDDQATYQKSTASTDQITTITHQKFIRFTVTHSRFWSRAEKTFLRKQAPLPVVLPAFKSMPKIHKPGRVKSRPIITAFNWYTRPLAIILNERIKQLNITLPFCLKSSQALLQCLPFTLEPGEMLVTIDVKAMYPNIDRLTLAQVVQALDPSNPTLPNILKFLLENSYCTYNNETYLQIQGIPMGDNASVNLANLFCDAFLDNAINNHPHTRFYRRYIDDIFLIWSGNTLELKVASAYWDTLSSLSLEVTDHSPTTINFLDVTIYRELQTNQLHTSLYSKPISKFAYLSPSSCHPIHTLKGWIYAEARRHYLLTSNPGLRALNLYKFKRNLLTRGYTHFFLEPIFLKALNRHFNRPSNTSNPPIPNPNPYPNPDPNPNPILPFVLPFYPDYRSAQIFSTIKRCLKRVVRRFLPTHRPILAHSALPNLASTIKKLN